MIGRQIRRIRLSRGLTQAQLVDGIYERSYLSLIERGKLIPSTEALRLFAKRLGVEVSLFETDNEATFNEAKELLQKGRTIHDNQAFKDSWECFSKCDALNEMIECVQEWAGQFSNFDVLRSLKVSLKQIESENFDMMIIFELRILIGNCYFYMGLYQEAAWTYQEIIDFYPPKSLIPRLQINLGCALMELEDYANAIIAFNRGIRHASKLNDKIKANLGLGRCCRYLGRLQEAMGYFQNVKHMSLNYDTNFYIYSIHAMAVVLLDSFKIKEVDGILQQVWSYYKYHKMKGREAELVEEFIRLNYYQQKYNTAMQWCDYALTLLENNNDHLGGRFLLWKSRIYEADGKSENAENLIEAAKIVLKDRFEKAAQNIDPLYLRIKKGNF